ncbi:MAG: hypothetical protein OXP66_03595 [Candidatus Tectomicrobia bacterium]|nr:hypothetical protein [Candidatus Tectomicrobia bacterium]
MFEIAALALVVSVAFVVVGKTAAPDHSGTRAWKHIRAHDRVYYMGRGTEAVAQGVPQG